MTTVLIDTGPLVAAIDRRDQWHEWSNRHVGQSPAPLLTCESVLSEAWFLLRSTDIGRRSLLDLLERGAVQVGFSLQGHLPRVVELIRRYANVPMSLADGCLVRMSETIPDSVVVTLDSDFRIYRRNRRQIIPLLTPPDV
ncbi:MAG: PIN domain-containing protein [Planctomycetes bacterium]|nr:PIN domain-containing protein [Planctomycetota bacterium]